MTDDERLKPGPFSRSLGFTLVSADEHAAVIEAIPGPDHVNGGVKLVCTARCLRAGRRVAAAEAEIIQDGQVIAKAMTTHARLDRD